MKKTLPLAWLSFLAIVSFGHMSVSNEPSGFISGDNCETAIDLSEHTSPYFGSTVEAENTFSICGLGNANDLVFYFDVEPGAGLELLHLYDNYTSRISLRWGGACPGENEIVCGTDIQENRQTWVNETSETQRVWLVEGASWSSGKFVLHWQYHSPGYCFSPTDLVATEHTEESVKLSWEDRAGAEEWELVYGPQGFNEETGGARLTVQEPFAVLTGLQSSTSYDYYVRAVCSPDNSGSWSSSSFNTECGHAVLPYEVGFTYADEVRCWNYLYSGWSNYSFYEGSISYSVNASSIGLHILPRFNNLLNGAFVRLTPLWYYGDSGILEIGTLSDPNDSTTFVSAATYPLNSSNFVLVDFSAKLDQIPEGNSYIGIRIVNTGTDYFQISLDAIEVGVAEGCMQPASFRVVDLAPRSAVLSWNELGSADEWELRIAPRNFDPEIEEQIFTAENTSFEIEGLKPNFPYQVYVRPTCAESDEWAGPLYFYTPNSCSAPKGISAERVSESSVLVSWEAEEDMAEWELRYTNLKSEELRFATVQGNADFLLEQLDPEAYYEVAVRTVCGGDDGKSWYSTIIEIPAVCASARVLPYTEKFKGIPYGSLPVCWDEDWAFNASGDLKVERDYQLGEYLYFNVSSYHSSITAILPELDQSYADVRVSFKTYKSSWNGDEVILQVGVQTDNGFVELESRVIESSKSKVWKEQRVYLRNAGLGEGRRLAFRLVTGEYEIYHDLYLTDVEVDVIPDIVEPHGLGVNDLNQTTGKISWLQFETAEKVEIIWGNKGFDLVNEAEIIELTADALNYQLTDLLPNTIYEVFVRNVATEGQVSLWAGPLQFQTPCEPMQINLLNVEENEVLSAEVEQVIRFTYNYVCFGQIAQVLVMGLDDDRSYSITEFTLDSEMGEFEFVLPATLWSGNYAVAVSYQDYDSQGLRSMHYAQSVPFILENKYPRIEIMRPAENSIVVIENEDHASLYLAWNTFALSSVKMEYTLDGGESWQMITKSKVVNDGFSVSGYATHRFLVPPSWVGKKIQFKVSSVFLPDVFDISEEVLVLDKYPFSITQGYYEVPLGTDLEIAYEMSISGGIEYSLYNASEGVDLRKAEDFLEPGSGVLKIATDDLMVGSNYYVRITGPGWNRTYYIDFVVTNPTNLWESRKESPKVKLYPVPANDLLYIHAPGLSGDEIVDLYDLTGRSLMKEHLGNAPLNLGHLKSGVYLLVIGGHTYKVIKQ